MDTKLFWDLKSPIFDNVDMVNNVGNAANVDNVDSVELTMLTMLKMLKMLNMSTMFTLLKQSDTLFLMDSEVILKSEKCENSVHQ